MGIPQAIKDQEEKADGLVKELAKGEIIDVVDNATPKPDEKKTDKDETTSPAPKTDESAQAPKGDDETLNQKYSVLQGKYNHETAELRRSLQQANNTISRQNEVILDLHNRLNSIEKSSVSKTDDSELPGDDEKSTKKKQAGGPKKLNPEDFEGYGSEMRDLVDGFNTLLEENQQLKGTVAKTQEVEINMAWDTFRTRMASAVPDWETLNYDPDFLNWLSGKDRRDKDTRKQKLDYFASQLDADSCAQFFIDYKQQSGKVEKPATPSRAYNKGDIIQPEPSASGADAPVPGAQNKTEVTKEDYDRALKAWSHKEISYVEMEKVSDAYQRTLAKQSRKK